MTGRPDQQRLDLGHRPGGKTGCKCDLCRTYHRDKNRQYRRAELVAATSERCVACWESWGRP